MFVPLLSWYFSDDGRSPIGHGQEKRFQDVWIISLVTYLFIEYEKHESTLDGVTQANNFQLDKIHTFLIQLFSDYKKWV